MPTTYMMPYQWTESGPSLTRTGSIPILMMAVVIMQGQWLLVGLGEGVAVVCVADAVAVGVGVGGALPTRTIACQGRYVVWIWSVVTFPLGYVIVCWITTSAPSCA